MVRIVHPFPSALDGLVTAALVMIAGGSVAAAVRLGVAMLALQAAIGTANDLVDEPLDRGRKAGKPLPRGLLTRGEARALVVGALVVGLALSALSGPWALGVAAVGAAIGFVYDRWLKGTLWSWLPFALGVPLVPVYAWLGAVGRLPAAFAVLVPAAVVAGAALALSNLLADVERDRAAGSVTAATRLGAGRTWTLNLALHAVVVGAAAVSLAAAGGRGWGIALAVGGVALIALGVALGRGGPAQLREWAWECQAAGVGALGAGWVAALAEVGAV